MMYNRSNAGKHGSEKMAYYDTNNGWKESNYVLSTSKWYHLAFVLEESNYIKFYVNGNLIGQLSLSSSFPAFTNHGRIGYSGYTGEYFIGRIDNLMIWNTARTASQIQQDMGTTLDGDESGLVAYYRFDQFAGSTLYDWSSNSNDGTLTNMTDDDWVASSTFNTWIGSEGTDWATDANWSLGVAPDSTSANVGIPDYTGGNQPSISGNYTCNHLTIHSGATLTINSTLTVNGNAFSFGTQSGNGGIYLSGASASHGIAGTFTNVELNESNGADLAGDVTVDDTLTLTSGTITLDGYALSYSSSSTLQYNGSTAQTTTSAEFPDSNGPDNLTIDNSSGVTLHDSRTINGTLTLTDGDLALNGKTVTLGQSATLSESDGNTVKDASGSITTTRTFNADDLSSGSNTAGLGAEITTNAALGETTITRGHAGQGNQQQGILRYFDISPANNSGLDATLVFHYDDSELNGNTESELELYRSTDSGSTWSNKGGTVDTDQETITLSGIDAFSRWTVFDGGFTNMVSLTGVIGSSVAWGDYDNDGDLDILLTGWTGSRISRIYRNDGNDTFANAVSLTGVNNSSVAWGDYDNDGDLDILLTGWTGSTEISRIYRNDGNDIFTNVESPTGVNNSSVAWGDYDNDGDLDILLTGWTGSGRISRIYRNDGNDTFTDCISLTGVSESSVAWGDYDNDGDLDILLTGWTGSSSISRIYRNNSLTANVAPNVPASLSASVSVQDVTLSWSKSTDNETSQNALTYNLRIGTSSGGIQTMSPMADVSNGYRKVAALGNTNHNNSWELKDLPNGTYYWSVQAVDNAFAGSAFSAEGVFGFIDITTASITNITENSATSGGEVTDEGGSSVTAKGVVWHTSENPTITTYTGKTNDGSGLGSFTSFLTGLASGQTYYVRAYATNSEGTGYGEQKVFATPMTPPG
ncbi:VCBS repeat-containing protein, partial [bacterium]|nr:VCBS repeat-containing protein [bacterium]